MAVTLTRRIERMHDQNWSLCNFRTQPFCSRSTGAAASGTTTHTNVWIFPECAFEEYVIGTQTTLVPAVVAGGLNVAMTLTADIGHEMGQGITARSRSAFTVGTDTFYGKLTTTIADVSGTDDCAFGFRKAAAYNVAIDSYTDFAVLNVISGNIKIETNLNSAGTVTTDTTDDWLDGGTHTLEVYVTSGGVVTYKIDGAAPTVTAAFTFDDTDVVIPFFYFLHDAVAPGAVTHSKWEVGLQ